MPKIAVVMLLTVVSIGGCRRSAESPSVPQAQSDEAWSRAAVAERYGDHVDGIEAAKKAGYDYLQVISKCLLRDESAMHGLFAMSQSAHFDGAASESRSDAVGFVLRNVGDHFFGKCLKKESEDVQSAVREDILFDMADEDPQSDDLVAIWFPCTFEGCRKSGDDEPTSAPATKGNGNRPRID